MNLRERFRIFARDGFACRYCGAKGPHVELEVDHVQPVSRGGTDHPLNLVTACRPCNRGKAAEEPEWAACSPMLDDNDEPDNHPVERWLESPVGLQDQWAWSDAYAAWREAGEPESPHHSDRERFREFWLRFGYDPDEVRRRWGPDGVGTERCCSE